MKKSIWGPLFWKTLHCMIIHINDSLFQSEKQILWENIKGIINIIPCPYCKQHATNYIKKVNHNSFKNKESMIKYIHNLHNEVNERLKKPIMDYETHLTLYKNMNVRDVFIEFLEKNLRDKNSVKMMLHSFHTKRFIHKLNKYLGDNIHKYL